MKRSTKQNSKNSFTKYLSITLIVLTLLVLALFYFINIFPKDYFIFICSLFIIIDSTLIILMHGNKKKKIFGAMFSFILILGMILLIVYEINTIDFLKQLGFKKYTIKNYSVLVLNDSKYTDIGDLKNKKIGVIDTEEESYKKARDLLKNKILVEFVLASDNIKIIENLNNHKVDAILIEDSQKMILEETDKSLFANSKIIYTFEIELKEEEIVKKVDVTKDSFNIYISGIDTFGKVNSASRSDVNMVVTVNPSTNQVLITSIPRDYYVLLGTKNSYDKLTHAGVYGITESVKTLEALLEIDINYYVRLNFTSLVDVVDTLGGIEVISEYEFTSDASENGKEYHFLAGLNELDGDKALAFVRERKSFADGDITRNLNQQIVIKAIIKKALTPAILMKYTSLLETLETNFITNMPEDQITTLIKKQLEEESAWDITTNILSGTESSEYTFTYPNAKLSVLIPNGESVNYAITKIKELQN